MAEGTKAFAKYRETTSEEFAVFFSEDLMELVDASDIDEAIQNEWKQAILAILTEGLTPAFENLKEIRASEGQQITAELYEQFSRNLWHAYKDLMPKATLLLGFDIAFVFQKESSFKKGSMDFRLNHHSLIASNLGDFFRRQRTGWQSNLARFRNHFLEPQAADHTKFAAFYEPNNAEMLFSVAWGVMANILPVFLEAKLPANLTIELIPEGNRAASNGKRFRVLKSATAKR